MNMNIIQRAHGMRPGNSIVRQYKNSKIQRNAGIVGTLMDFSFAAQHASEHHAGWATVFGGFTCLMIKLTKDAHLRLKSLRPQYEEIVARARQIYKK